MEQLYSGGIQRGTVGGSSGRSLRVMIIMVVLGDQDFRLAMKRVSSVKNGGMDQSRLSLLQDVLENLIEDITGVRAAVSEILLGQKQQSFPVHLEGVTVNGMEGELILGPAQPLGNVLPAPLRGGQT